MRHTSHILGGMIAATFLAGAALFGAASPALAHDELVGKSLDTDSDTGAATAVRLSYSNELIETGIEANLLGGEVDEDLASGARLEGRDLVLPLPADLPERDYMVVWRVVSSDGHPIEGAFLLDVFADGSAEIGDEVTVVPGEDGTVSTEDAPNEGEINEAEGSDDTSGDNTNNSAEQAEGTEAESGLPAWGVALLAVGGVAVIAVIVAAILVGQRRRREALEGAAGASSSDPTAEATDGTADGPRSNNSRSNGTNTEG